MGAAQKSPLCHSEPIRKNLREAVSWENRFAEILALRMIPEAFFGRSGVIEEARLAILTPKAQDGQSSVL